MKKHVLWALLLAGIILAPQISSAMVFPAADWHERTPESQGVDSKKLNAALKYLESQSGFDGITETVVIRNGYMIWKGDNIDKKHSVASISKAFTSTCLGLLIDDGKCKLSDLAKKYEPRLDCKYPEYGRITIRHFANFTSGYDAVNPKNKGYGIKDPDDGSNTPLDPTTPVFEPGTMYSYFDDAMCMFGLVLTKIGQDSLYEIFRHRIADPIGVNPNQWDWTDIGEFDGFTINNAAGGINITARTLARFGHLILNHGNWNGKQLISKNWLDEAVKVQVPNTMKGRMDTSRQRVISVRAVGTYGYHWWANGILADGSRYFPDAPPGTFYRSGWPRQRLFIIPEWNMVIVRIGLDKHKTDRPANVRTCWNTVLKMVGKAITDTPTIAGKQLVPRISSAMVFPGADWKESKPEAQGVDTAKFDTAINYLGDQLAKRGGISELVIIRNGYMIHKGSNIDRKHCVASATKSFASTVLGHLIDKRKCSLDTLAKDYVSLLREKYPEVTLRHFATMTSGYDAVNPKNKGYGDDPDDGSHSPLVPTDPAFPPGAKYSYFDDAMAMFGYVLTKIAGTDLESYFRKHIARPIGMQDSSWEWRDNYDNTDRTLSNPEGVDVRSAPGGMNISAREMARLGHLFLNRGNWNGKRIISSKWVDEATRVQVPPTMKYRDDSRRQRRLGSRGVGTYGYNWWVNDVGQRGKRLWPDVPIGTYFASGNNNNKCIVIPEWNMVIVRMGTSGYPRRYIEVWNTFLKMIGKTIKEVA